MPEILSIILCLVTDRHQADAEWKESLLDHPALMVDVIEEIGGKDSKGKITHGSSLLTTDARCQNKMSMYTLM